ncbi:MAG: Hpt domain-containing protein, partial [Candidatus Thiodiazotropha endolucinida]
TADIPTQDAIESNLVDLASYQLDEELFEIEGDDELVEIFVEEGRELLDNLEQRYNGWIESPLDTAVVDEFKRSLHTLKGSSSLAGINPIGDLSHGLENLFERMSREEIEPDATLQNMVRQALDVLATQIDDAESGGNVRFSSQLLSNLEAPLSSTGLNEIDRVEVEDETIDGDLQLAEVEDDDLEEELQLIDVEDDVVEEELPLPEDNVLGEELDLAEIDDDGLEEELQKAEESGLESPRTEAVDTSSYYDEPMSFLHDGDLFEVSEDPELVEIFIEESRELMEALEANYNRWCENRADHTGLDGMQRALHTIKGSSRLAGIEPVGDLSHAMESLLNGVVRGQVDLSDRVFAVVRQALDLIATQTDDVANTGKVHQADPMIERIQEIIDNASLEEDSIEELIDPSLEEELEESERGADAVAESAPDDEDLVIPFESFNLDGVNEEASNLTDESFMLAHDEVLLDVGEDDELVQIFIEEAKEFIELIESSYQQWFEDVEDHTAIDGVQRNLHTVKG